MKGIIFNQLEEMVAANYGPDTWDRVLSESQLITKDGLFVGPKTYPDEDLFALVGTASRLSGKPVDELVVAFGRFIFPTFAKRYSMFFRPGMTAKSFLKSVDQVIHVEVRKLQPEAVLPTLRYEDPSPTELVILYQSPRKMCDLAVGLIDGVGAHFNETIQQKHASCLKHGDLACRIECTFSAAPSTK